MMRLLHLWFVHHLYLLLLLLLVVVVAVVGQESSSSTSLLYTCPVVPPPEIPPINTTTTTKVYKVGVLAIRGNDTAYREFNQTFGEYLTLTAGMMTQQTSDSMRIRFEMIPLNFITLFTQVKSKAIDFIYVNPSAYSCIESEYGAQSLVSQISRRVVGGKSYDLTKFGGVIATLRNNTEVNTLQDLKDKIIAAASISGLGSGQMQFRQMEEAGMSFIQDPKQLVFTSNQGKVVDGLLNGEFDVGFIRTDQLERTPDPNNSSQLIQNVSSIFKIIDPQSMAPADKDFPFQSSTPLYPEWNLAALPHVPAQVSAAVQEAMKALSVHAKIGKNLVECEEENETEEEETSTTFTTIITTTNQSTTSTTSYCDTLEFPQDFVDDSDEGGTTEIRCDTTKSIARAAYRAMLMGKYAGWRTTLSYMELRSMQETTGFITLHKPTKTWRCIRAVEIYESIVCPEGTFRMSKSEMTSRCTDLGLECRAGYQCLCSPCHEGFDVDVFPISGTTTTQEDEHDDHDEHHQHEEEHEHHDHHSSDNENDDHDHDEYHSSSHDDDHDADEDDHHDHHLHEEEEGEHDNHNHNHRRRSRKLFDVDDNNHDHDHHNHNHPVGCPKMSVCGTTVLNEPITFRAIDHLERKGEEMTVLVHEGTHDYEVNVTIYKGNGTWLHHDLWYEFTLPARELGMVTMEIFIGNQQIQESPLRVLVINPNCEAIYGSHYEPSSLGNGECVCKSEYVAVGGSCLSYLILLPSILVPLCVLIGVISLLFVQQKRREADSIWTINPRELEFPEKSIVLGHGTFGVVLLANFHGTDVAVKKVLPPRGKQSDDSSSRQRGNKKKKKHGDVEAGGSGMMRFPPAGLDSSVRAPSSATLGQSADGTVDINTQPGERHSEEGGGGFDSEALGTVSGFRVSFGNGSLNDIHLLLEENSKERSGTSEGKSFLCFGHKDRYERMKSDFIQEMRLLSKLRHPCITTLMGAVVYGAVEPLLVMEHMSFGSLYDLLHNYTLYIDGEILLPMLRDIAQGLRFLHSADPVVIHGDIKSKNILVSHGFRAKVADFGLSQKRKSSIAIGTPYWMAPELLRGESRNTTASDMYALGIVLYEVYSRKTPYEGLNTAAVLKLVCDPLVNKRPLIPTSCPREICSLMKACWKANPYQRPTAEELDERFKFLPIERVEPATNNPRRRPSNENLFDGSEKNTIKRQKRLYQAFPKRVADQLARGEKVEPEKHECVTIVLCHIVNFIRIASGFPPSHVSNMLDRLYAALDEPLSKFQLFKVETIREGYMAVANLNEPQTDHAKRVAEFALEVIQLKVPIDEEDISKGYIQLRVGFTSGPVVSNVVGTLNPRYSLFGDTINVASKMERRSAPQQVLCSSSSAKLLWKQAPRDTFELTRRREGGKSDTYWVNQALSEGSS